MTRILTALVAGAILLGAAAPIATAQPHRFQREMKTDCQFDYLDSAAWTHREELVTARCLVQHFPVSGGLPKLDSVIDCESHWNRFVVGGAGDNYVGLGQHDSGSWSYRVNAYEPAHWNLKSPWWNARSNLTVTVRMAHSSGWGAWAGCA